MPVYDSTLFNPPAPAAKVTLRNPDGGAVWHEVVMLIDSGADVTLVPTDFVNQLGVETILDMKYELAGFNGSKSLTSAVWLDLIFLNQAFRGQFLLIDQEWGILGRDILNLMSLLLDGPGLMWNQQTPSSK